MVLGREALASVEAREGMAELDAILASPRFRAAPRLSRLLRYIVEKSLANVPAELKEHQIGVDVFDRRVGYETSSDPVVRVEARQLRFKLADYYAGPGLADEIVISVPKGGYLARFERRVTEPGVETRTPESTPPTPTPAKPSRRLRWMRTAAIIGSVIALLGIGLWALRMKLPWTGSG
jgi:hypothetical protein